MNFKNISRINDKRILAEELLPELKEDKLRIAAVLRGARYRACLTQVQLAKKMHIKQHHISAMENSKRPIGKAMAKQFAKILKCEYKVFL